MTYSRKHQPPRFNPTNVAPGDRFSGMNKSASGRFVTFDAHVKAIVARDELIARLKQENAEYFAAIQTMTIEVDGRTIKLGA